MRALRLPFRPCLIASVLLATACQSVGLEAAHGTAHAPPHAPQQAQITMMLDELYGAFCFDAGGEADWVAIRRASAPGATYFSPIAPDKPPKGVGVDPFINGFQSFIRSSPLGVTGYYERILHTRIDRFGTVAHAYVAFEGYVPGEEADRRGVDSIQLVLQGTDWLVASFATQYESPDDPLPSRFLGRGLE